MAHFSHKARIALSRPWTVFDCFKQACAHIRHEMMTRMNVNSCVCVLVTC